MSENVVDVKIVASAAPLSAAFAEASTAVKTASAEIKAETMSLGGAFSSLIAPLAGIAAAFAVFHEIKSSISETKEFNDEVIKLAKTLGITTEEASVLAVALGDVFVSTDTYTKAALMMTRQINSGAKAFTTYGISIRDANGNLKPTPTLMSEVLNKLNSLQQGTDRNTAGLAFFSRSWGESQKLLMLSPAVFEEARKKAEALGLMVGGDVVAAQMRYKTAMQDIHDVTLGFKLALGNALLPVLADLAEWFTSIAPPIITAVTVLIKLITANVLIMANAVNIAIDALIGLGAALTGNFAVAKQSIVAMKDDTVALIEKLKELASPKKPTTGTRAGSPGTDDAAGPSRVPQWKKDLDDMQHLQENWSRDSNDLERNFWSQKLALSQIGTEEYRDVFNMLQNELMKSQEKSDTLVKQGLDDQLADIKAGSATTVEIARAKLQAAMQYQALIQQQWGAASQKNLDALRAVRDANRDVAIEIRNHWTSVFDTIQSSFKSAFTGMLQHTKTFAQAMNDFGRSLLSAFIANKVKELEIHVATERSKEGATWVGVLQQVAAEAWAGIEKAAIWVANGLKFVAIEAWKAAAAVFTSIASIPIVGPFIAPALAAVAVAAVLAFGTGIASAAGGFDIPSGLNPITQLHASEMVLPANLAEKVRNMTDGGGGGDIHIHAMDVASFKEFVMKNRGALTPAVRELARNGAFTANRRS